MAAVRHLATFSEVACRLSIAITEHVDLFFSSSTIDVALTSTLPLHHNLYLLSSFAYPPYHSHPRS
jgi:hypothetical protein